MESRNTKWWKSPGGAVVVLLLGSMAMAGVVQGTPPASNPGQPFQEILDAIDALSDAQTQIATQFGAQVDDIQNTVNDIEDKLDVLDVKAIGEAAFADAGENSTADIPNNNALILVRVTWKGEGISGLTASDFTIATRLVPPGECGLEIDELYTFGAPNGDYGLAVTPIDTEGCDWASGSYISSIEVSSGGMKGSTLVEIKIA